MKRDRDTKALKETTCCDGYDGACADNGDDDDGGVGCHDRCWAARFVTARGLDRAYAIWPCVTSGGVVGTVANSSVAVVGVAATWNVGRGSA